MGARALVVVAALAAALGVTTRAQAARTLPLERVALERFAHARTLDPATRAIARNEIERAARLIRVLPNGRGYHVSVALEELASFPAPLTGPRALALVGALRANDDYFAKHWAPEDKTHIVGADGVVYEYFGGYCFRFHPLANFSELNTRIALGDEPGTQELADALIARGIYQPGGGIAWEYDFPFQGGRPPWISGMAQSVAAQAFARAAQLVSARADAYTREAQAAFRVIPRRLITNLSAGPWIRLYAFSPVVVLNAQLQSILSLQTYATLTGDGAAGALAARMQSAAAAMLPRFDTGYWSYYALPRVPSPADYHHFVVTLLLRLAGADPRFATAALRFRAYEHEPPAFQLANGGVGQVELWLSKPAAVTATTPAGPTKRVSLLDGWHTLTWTPSKAGVYPVHVTASDWAGNTTAFDALPLVRVLAATRSTSTAAVPGQPSFLVGSTTPGLSLLRTGVTWPAGATAPDPALVASLNSLAPGASLLVELNGGTQPDETIAQYAASLVQQVPSIRFLVLAPSPPPNGATQYAAALAALRDAVHAVAPAVAVGAFLDGADSPRATTSALALAGAAADVVVFRPALTTTGGQWTQPNLLALTNAFGGTLPPLVLDGTPPTQTDADAIRAASCSRYVTALVLNDAPDPSLVSPAQRGTIVCPGLAIPAAPVGAVLPPTVTSGTPVSFQLGCARDCLYLATLVGANGQPVVARRGSLQGGAPPQTIALPRTTLGQASYRLDVRIVNRVNPGSAVDLTAIASNERS